MYMLAGIPVGRIAASVPIHRSSDGVESIWSPCTLLYLRREAHPGITLAIALTDPTQDFRSVVVVGSGHVARVLAV